VDKCDDKIKLILNMCGGVWKPEFVFPLTAVGVQQVDILEAKIRDLQEEIEYFKAEKAAEETVYLYLASNIACALSQHVDWRADFPQRCLNEKYFTLSADGKEVVVLSGGLYQINVRLCGCNSSNGQNTKLQLNGVEVASCYHANANSFQCHINIHEIVMIEAGAKLRVQSGFNSNTLADINGNRFTMLRLP
jgi:hypothetical protein